MFDDLKVSDWWFLGIASVLGYVVVKHFIEKFSVSSTGKKNEPPDLEQPGQDPKEKHGSSHRQDKSHNNARHRENESNDQTGQKYAKGNESASEVPPNSKASSQNSLRWYEVLEVDSKASLEEIKLAYKRKIRLYHPDKVAGLGPEFMVVAEAKAKEINSAYQQACISVSGQ